MPKNENAGPPSCKGTTLTAEWQWHGRDLQRSLRGAAAGGDVEGGDTRQQGTRWCIWRDRRVTTTDRAKKGPLGFGNRDIA